MSMPWEAILSAAVTLNVAIQGLTLRMVYDLKSDLSQKVDVDDHDKQQSMCREEIFESRAEYRKRNDARVENIEGNFYDHSHESLPVDARLIIGRK